MSRQFVSRRPDWMQSRPRLDARERIGVYARRRVRAQVHAWLRGHWPAVAVLLSFGTVGAAIAHVLLPTPVNAYVSAAVLTSAVWWICSMTADAAGVRHLRMGIAAEEWTNDELRPLKTQGWRAIHHVRLEGPDVDHVLIGPAGWFALETKYRRDWSLAAHELSDIARRALRSADQVRLRIDPRGRPVEAVVVMWGSNAAATAAAVKHPGVVFCAGNDLRAHLRSRPVVVAPAGIEVAFERLAHYVERRDRGEATREGQRVRLLEASLTDLVLVAAVAVAASTGILSAVSLDPSGWSSVALAAAVAVGTVVVRRRTRSSVRTQRVTVAVLTTSAGLGVLLLILATWSAL